MPGGHWRIVTDRARAELAELLRDARSILARHRPRQRLERDALPEAPPRGDPTVDESTAVPDLEAFSLDRLQDVEVLLAVHLGQHDVAHLQDGRIDRFDGELPPIRLRDRGEDHARADSVEGERRVRTRSASDRRGRPARGKAARPTGGARPGTMPSGSRSHRRSRTHRTPSARRTSRSVRRSS